MTHRPILFIGLGGVGAQVLTTLRRRLFDQTGAASPPHVAFLCIDSHKVVDLPERAEPAAVALAPGEWIAAPLDLANLAEIRARPKRFPHLAAWFDPSVRPIHPAAGTTGVRALGRLAFFQNYRAIRDSLAAKLNALAPNGAPVEVKVVTSLAGGLGSGMLVDLGFLLRDLRPDALSSEAVILLPSLFDPSDGSPTHASAYAALLELEHYSRAADDGGAPGFRAAWTRAEFDAPRQLRGPVFDISWLVGPEAGEDSRASDTGTAEALAIVAEHLFVRHGGHHAVLAERIRDTLDAAVDGLGRTVRLSLDDDPAHGPAGGPSQELSCRYGAFGLARIYAAQGALDRGEGAVSRMLARWLAVPPVRDERVARLIAGDDLYLGEKAGRARLKALYAEIQTTGGQTTGGQTTGGKTAGRAMAEQWSARAAELLAQPADPAFAGQLLAARDELGRAWLAEDGGTFNALLKANGQAVFARIEARLNALVTTALSDERDRFPAAIAALEALHRRYGEIAEAAEASSHLRRERLDRYRTQTQTLLGYLGSWAPRVRRAVAEVAAEAAGIALLAELDLLTDQQIAVTCRRARELIGQPGESGRELVASLQARLADLRAALARMKAGIDQRLVSAQTGPSSTRNIRLDAAGGSAAGSGEDALGATLERRFHAGDAEGRPSTSLWALAQVLRDGGDEAMLARLATFADVELSHLTEQASDIPAAFAARHGGAPDGQPYRGELAQWASAGAPRLALRAGASEDWPAQTSRVQILLARHGQGAAGPRGRFEATIQAALAPHDPVVVEGPADTAYLHTQSLGFPLSAIAEVADYRKAYLARLAVEAEGMAGLHGDLDIERYADIVPLGVEEARARSSAIQTLALALASGLAWPEARDGGFVIVYRHYDGDYGFPQSLGLAPRAIRTLSSADRDDRQLAGQVADLLNNQADPRTLARLIVLLDRAAAGEDAIRTLEWCRAAGQASRMLGARHGELRGEVAIQRAALATWAQTVPPEAGPFWRIKPDDA